MLSSAEAPIRPKPIPAPRIVIAAPIPAPMAPPERVELVGTCAHAGAAVNNRMATATYANCNAFMRIRYSVSKVYVPGGSSHRPRPNHSPGAPERLPALMLRMDRHTHEQRGQKDKNVRLQKGDKELQQTQRHHAQHAADRNRGPQGKFGG